MAKAAANSTKKKQVPKSENDAFTAILGLVLLILTATTVFACWRSMELFGSFGAIFKVGG